MNRQKLSVPKFDTLNFYSFIFSTNSIVMPALSKIEPNIITVLSSIPLPCSDTDYNVGKAGHKLHLLLAHATGEQADCPFEERSRMRIRWVPKKGEMRCSFFTLSSCYRYHDYIIYNTVSDKQDFNVYFDLYSHKGSQFFKSFHAMIL